MTRILEETKARSLRNSLGMQAYTLSHGTYDETQSIKELPIKNIGELKLRACVAEKIGFEYSWLEGRINIGNNLFPQTYYFAIMENNPQKMLAQIRFLNEELISVTPEQYKTTLKNVSRDLYNLYIYYTDKILETLRKDHGDLPAATKQDIEKIINDSTHLAF